MSNQWIRKWRLTIKMPQHPVWGGVKVIDKSTQNSFDRQKNIYTNNLGTDDIVFEDPFKIEFTARKTVQMDANKAKITIYNLSPNTEYQIIEEGARVVLEAGYDNNMGVIFEGHIIQPLRGKRNGTDYFLTLICLSDDDFLNLAFVSGTFNSNLTKRDVALQVVRSSTIKPSSIVIEDLPNIDIVDGSRPRTERPKTVFGKPKNYLRSIGKMAGSSPFTDDGVLRFFDPNKPPEFTHEINVKTGMIGSPTQVDYGVDVKVLLNPQMRLGDFIKIDNRSVLQQENEIGKLQFLLENDGIYRIIGIEYVGDSRGQEWYSNLTTITKAGKIPAALRTNIGNTLL